MTLLVSSPIRRLLAARLSLATALQWAARIGYAARGAVYVGLGAIALLAALDLTPKAKGARGVLETWAAWPLGGVLIALIASGLIGFAVWRFVQALFDADRHGTTLKGWAVRAGQALSGAVYGSLAWSALELLDVFEDVGEADETQSAHQYAEAILAWPSGDRLLIAAGLIVLGFGIGNVAQGLMQDFAKRLSCDAETCARIVPLAKVGYAARGLATLPLGAFLIVAGLEVRASQARSWGDALQVVEQQPAGAWILAIVAAGLVAFGLFGFAEAFFRRIRPPEVL